MCPTLLPICACAAGRNITLTAAPGALQQPVLDLDFANSLVQLCATCIFSLVNITVKNERRCSESFQHVDASSLLNHACQVPVADLSVWRCTCSCCLKNHTWQMQCLCWLESARYCCVAALRMTPHHTSSILFVDVKRAQPHILPLCLCSSFVVCTLLFLCRGTGPYFDIFFGKLGSRVMSYDTHRWHLACTSSVESAETIYSLPRSPFLPDPDGKQRLQIQNVWFKVRAQDQSPVCVLLLFLRATQHYCSSALIAGNAVSGCIIGPTKCSGKCCSPAMREQFSTSKQPQHQGQQVSCLTISCCLHDASVCAATSRHPLVLGLFSCAGWLQGREYPDSLIYENITLDIPKSHQEGRGFAGGYALGCTGGIRICDSYVAQACLIDKTPDLCVVGTAAMCALQRC